MNYVIGADLGTSALKLLLVDETGAIVKTVVREYDVYSPQPGWSQQNPLDWWEALLNGIEELCNQIDRSCVTGIGVAGQMHGLVSLDENDQVIRPAILWNDGRTAKQTQYLNTVIGESKLAEHTANIAFAGFTAPKLLWMKENEPELFGRIHKIMLPKDYINYLLTGVHATDFSDASGMLLLDVEHRCWSKPMLEICGITEEQLPRLFESFEVIGTLRPEVAAQWGFGENVTVIAGAGDNAAAAMGMGTCRDGLCNISLGTSGTVFIATDTFKALPTNAIHNFCHANGKYHFMGCILSAASCNKWFCEEVLHAEDFAAAQAKIPEDLPGNNNVFFLPYLMGERSPINDTNATGVFIGMRPDTTREQMLLAVLEGVSFAIKDNMEIVKNSGVNINRSTVCGGGAKSRLWMQILASILNLELQIPQVEEGPGYGMAKLILGGNEAVAIKEVVKPDPILVQKYQEKYHTFQKIYPALKQLFQSL